MKNIVITAGGTKEPIDNVRSITNSSSGKLGLKIANEFARKIDETSTIFYIHGKDASPLNIDTKNINVQNIQIKDTNDLAVAVEKVLTENQIDIFVHSMAVADYTVDCVFDMDKFKDMILGKILFEEDFNRVIDACTYEKNGKISSSINSLSIKLKKTPKIIEMIKKISPHTFLVGFKLLDNVSKEELFDVGFNLLRKNKCNLVLANDISKIRSGNHEGMLIYPEKSYDCFAGKDEIAEKLVSITLRRECARHPKSIMESSCNDIDTNHDVFKEMKLVGAELYKQGFLPEVMNHERTDKIGTYGNMSIRNKDNFYITCRNVHKGNLSPECISKITNVLSVDEASVYTNVYYNSEIKPSIDTSIHHFIYQKTDFNAILHIHTDNVFLGIPYIDEQYPCGSEPEMKSVVNELINTDIVQMKKHGLIICGNTLTECADKLNQIFMNVPYIDKSSKSEDNESIEHIREVNADFVETEGMLYNIRLANDVIGVVWEKDYSDSIHFGLFTKQCVRGKRLGIVSKYLKLYSKDYYLYTMKDCNIEKFYKEKYGFEDFKQIGDLYILKK